MSILKRTLSNWRSWTYKPYVFGTELLMKQYDNQLSYPLNNIMNAYYGLRTTPAPLKALGTYQPVPETRGNQYYALDGHCCTNPSQWLWTSTKGYGRETADWRESLNWQLTVAGQSFTYIITDDPLSAMDYLNRAGRRNLSVISN